jgi:hypothetical protein
MIASLLYSETKCPPRTTPLDSRLRGNDENDTPVIPGEHRETRNPGVPRFYPLA